MGQMSQILINKNRGWRGLAEVDVFNDDKELQLKQVFSFSQPVWDDLMFKGRLVCQDENYYYILHISPVDRDRLPIDHQRSVLIKDFKATITEVNRIEKAKWTAESSDNWVVICHAIKNRNNHTTSDWNCIGIRVIPEI